MRNKPAQEKLEIMYLAVPQKPKKPPLPQPRKDQQFLPGQHSVRLESPFIQETEKTAFKPHTLKESDRQILHNPLTSHKDVITVKKKITIPALESPPINNPSYMRYYHIVREQIKRAAYRAYAGREKGEVNVTFVILDNGTLEGVWLNTDKSARSEYLCSIAIRSIRDASPFPSFPQELKEYIRLSFNVAITFESD